MKTQHVKLVLAGVVLLSVIIARCLGVDGFLENLGALAGGYLMGNSTR